MLLLLSLTAHAGTALFLGNSFTMVGELDVRVAELLVEGDPTGGWTATRLADGGLTLPIHLSRVETDGTTWAAALGADGPAWDWVILQDQSQIPGFPTTEPTYVESLAAAVSLDGYAAARGATTVFFSTWGYLNGDETNPTIYADFSAMEGRLEDGYRAYQAATTSESRTSWIAPVGPAFARVYAWDVTLELDPTAADSHFARLYSGDGHHPSPLGTYLAACVFYATLTGESPVGLAVPAPVTAEDGAWLQSMAADTVFDESLGYVYPWSKAEDSGGSGGGSSGGGETGDSGSDSGSGADSAADSGGDSAEDSAPAPDDDTGAGLSVKADGGETCGCSSGAGIVGLLGLGMLRRRARR